MRKQELLDKFGSVYIDFVRDSVLMQVQNIFDNTAKSQLSKNLSYKVHHIPPQYREIIKILIKAAIDKSLHYTLFMLQEYEEEMQLIMHDEDYHTYSLAEISDGLCGELYGEDGWIKKYSKYSTWIEDLENSNEKKKKRGGIMSTINQNGIGSNFDDFLDEIGILEKVTAIAHKRILAKQIKQVMEQKHITKLEMAKKNGRVTFFNPNTIYLK